MVEHLETAAGRRIAHVAHDGRGPWIVFLGGFMSDMEGSKALFLEGWARDAGRAFLRLDYSGHGRSSGAFEAGCVGDWAEDARAVIEARTEGPVVLVGSSMGGWIALLLARAMPGRVAAMVGIAAAPDFTRPMLAAFGPGDRAALGRGETVARPSDYGAPYPITPRLIADGEARAVMDAPPGWSGPVRLLQGTEDADVARDVALRLLDHLEGDVRLTLVKGADHRFSDPACLALIAAAIEEVAP